MIKAVAGIVEIDGKVLIGKKIIKDGHFLSGRWHIPGGHMEIGETEEQALLREFKEETGLDVKIINKLCEHELGNTGVVVSWYQCKTDTFNVIPGDDLEQIKFVDKSLVPSECDVRGVSLWPKEALDYFSNNL